MKTSTHSTKWTVQQACACVALMVGLCAIQACLAAPPADKHWDRVEELSDEFEGESLDTTKWDDHNPRWLGRAPGIYSKQNVEVKDGKLALTAREEDIPGSPPAYHSFTTSAVKSKKKILYGYFEVMAKPMKARLASAFWLYDHDPQMWTEIDVFEIAGGASEHEFTYHMNAHVFHTPDFKGTDEDHLRYPAEWRSTTPLASQFRLYGLEWNKQEIRWFVDGGLVRSLKNQYWHQPLYVNLDTETMPNWFGLPTKSELPASFLIEYIRSWRRIGAN